MWDVPLHYWWWILALILIAGEVLAPGFFLLWIGIAAAVMGIVTWLVPGLGVIAQAVLFVILAFASCAFYWRFIRARLAIDADSLVDHAVTESLDALPNSLRVKGDVVPLDYELKGGQSVARLTLREGQARRVRSGDLPKLDRPLVFAARRGAHPPITADTLDELQRLLERHPAREPHEGAGSRRGGGRQRHQRGGPRGRGRRH